MDYISSDSRKTLDRTFRTASIIVFGFCLSILVILLVGRLVTPGEPIPGSEKWGRTIYSAVIVIGLSVVALRRFFLSPFFLGTAMRSGPAQVPARLQAMAIVLCAIAESVAILGLLFYLLTGDYQYSWRLGVVSLLLTVYSLPRRGEWERAVAAAEKSAAA